MIDTHCHLQFNAYKNDGDDVAQRCFDKGVILNVVGSQIATSERAVGLAEKYDDVYASVGLHPAHLFASEIDEEEVNFRARAEEFDYEKYKALARHPKVIGIGECGLELFHLPNNVDKETVLEKQRQTFISQHKLAVELGLPIIIHVRDAHDEMLSLLKRIGGNINGVVHCFTADWPTAQQYLDMGLYLGFTGIITFAPKKTNPQPQIDLLEVVKNCPLDRILIETDAPYLAPQAYRGQRCEPWMVVEVAKKIAEIRGLGKEEIIEITTKNAKKLFSKMV